MEDLTASPCDIILTLIQLVYPNDIFDSYVDDRVVNEAIFALGNIVGESFMYRDFALNHRAMANIFRFQEKLVKQIIVYNYDKEHNTNNNVKDNHNVTNGKVINYLENTTWAVLRLFHYAPVPELTFAKQPIYPLADVLVKISANLDLHMSTHLNNSQRLKLIQIVDNICWCIQSIVKLGNLQKKEEEEKDNDNSDNCNEKKSQIFELLKESKILECIMKLITNVQMSDESRYGALRVFSRLSTGSDECVDYMLDLGILDVLSVCMSCKPLGYGCPNVEHDDKLGCYACKVLECACNISGNIACGTKEQLLQLMEDKQLDIKNKLLTFFNRSCNKVVAESVYAIRCIVQNFDTFVFTQEMKYLINETNLICGLSELLVPTITNEKVLECVIYLIDAILSRADSTKHFNLLVDAGIFEKVSFFRVLHIFVYICLVTLYVIDDACLCYNLLKNVYCIVECNY